MTIFFRSRFFISNFLQKYFKARFFQSDPTCVKQDQKFFQSATEGAVANSGSSLLFLFRNVCRSTAIKFNKER